MKNMKKRLIVWGLLLALGSIGALKAAECYQYDRNTGKLIAKVTGTNCSIDSQGLCHCSN